MKVFLIMRRNRWASVPVHMQAAVSCSVPLPCHAKVPVAVCAAIVSCTGGRRRADVDLLLGFSECSSVGSSPQYLGHNRDMC